MWLNQVAPALGWHLDYDAHSDGGTNWNGEIWFQQLLHGSEAADLIGTDATNGITYWHLTGMSASYAYEGYVASHDICFNPPVTFSHVNKGNENGVTVGIYDGNGGSGSDTRPLDSAVILSHSGYPVIASVIDAAGNYWPVAAGESSALTVEAAQAACFPGSLPNFAAGSEIGQLDVWIHDHPYTG